MMGFFGSDYFPLIVPLLFIVILEGKELELFNDFSSCSDSWLVYIFISDWFEFSSSSKYDEACLENTRRVSESLFFRGMRFITSLFCR